MSLSVLLLLGLRLASALGDDGHVARRQDCSGPPASTPTVSVKNGTYTGVYAEGYHQDFFLGMPYAQKAMRFTQALPLNTSWQDSHSATAYPPECIGYGGDDMGYELSEDCLYLNVIRPSGTNASASLPVALWIHGGGLVMGGSADRRYNLSFIVENSVDNGTPMLGVSINYRLSAFGFLQGREAMAAGVTNIGFHDQRLAMRWVNENIAAFGGDPAKVTIWGESSGAESVSAQTLAYNGRDDKLFRGVMAESGFGGFISRYPGNFNNTELGQATYNILVTNTSCASTVNTSASLDCLRTLPFAEINAALNGTAAAPWPPVLDGDFIADYPSRQTADGRFVHVPILIGSNSDEGTAFGTGRGPGGGGVNTDAEMAGATAASFGPEAANETGKAVGELVDELLYLYPDIQAVGIPSLQTYPEVILPGSALARLVGAQYRRTGALFGDLVMHFQRRRANIAWSNAGVPSYAYRFDVVVNGVPAYVGATHFQEVAYVFDNTAGVGYAVDPFANETSPAYAALAKTMSTAWVNFVTGLDPNGAAPGGGLGLAGGSPWPSYNATSGGGVGRGVVWSVNGTGSYVEPDSFRAAGIHWMIDNCLAVFGL